MNSKKCSISTCKNCRHFHTEGRRGGTCAQFGTFTDPAWDACPLAISAFETVAQDIQPITVLEHAFALEFVGESPAKACPEKSAYSG